MSQNFEQPNIWSEISKMNWSPMKALAKESPIAAHNWFIDQLVLEKSKEKIKKQTENKRNLLWRKLNKIKK